MDAEAFRPGGITQWPSALGDALAQAWGLSATRNAAPDL